METIFEIIKKISKKSNLTILLMLKDSPKRWSQLEKVIYKKNLYQSINELFDLGLIEATIVHDTPTGSKAYQLTPLGKKVVQLLEQIEKEFEEYHSKAPPKDPKEFINELLDDD